jgi:hypothetical protein
MKKEEKEKRRKKEKETREEEKEVSYQPEVTDGIRQKHYNGDQRGTMPSSSIRPL